MKTMKIKRIELVNFKGLRQEAIDFYTSGPTTICGRNRTGKTTICDAFSWLLFGKTHDGRSTQNFNLKTRDAFGLAIPEVEHTVTAWVEITDEAGTREIKLQRALKENWVTKRGTTERTYTGDTEEYYWDELKVKATEWKERIAAICDEDVFMLITNPMRFTSLPQKEQREQLIRMAGGISLQDIAEGNETFMATLAGIGQDTIDDYIARTRNKAFILRKEIEIDTARLEENKAQIFTEEGTDRETHLDSQRKYREAIERRERMFISADASIKEHANALKALYDKKAEIQRKISGREAELIAEANKAYTEACNKKGRLQGEITGTLAAIDTAKREAADATKKLTNELNRLNNLQRQYDEELATTFCLSEDSLVCPTCHRPLEGDDRMAAANRLAAKWNADKSKRLEEIDKEGQESNKEAERLKTAKETAEKRQAELETKLQQLTQEHESTVLPEQIKAQYSDDEQWQELTRQMNETTGKIQLAEQQQKEMDADTAVAEARKTASRELVQFKELLERETAIIEKYANNDRIEKRMTEIQAKIDAARGGLASMQICEDNAIELQRAYMTEVEERVNKMFHHVRFTLFEKQKNGGTNDKCQANVNGVPYADVNNADQINAGLDIIDALCRYHSTCAPIFIDNAEGVNTLYETQAQQVRLAVTDDDATLRVTHTEKY